MHISCPAICVFLSLSISQLEKMPVEVKHQYTFSQSVNQPKSTESDCIIHGYIKKLGGPFASAWQTRYAKLYPNRVELHSESSSGKPELIFMDQLDDVSSDFVQTKGENCIVLKTKDSKIVLTNPVTSVQFEFTLNPICLKLLSQFSLLFTINFVSCIWCSDTFVVLLYSNYHSS